MSKAEVDALLHDYEQSETGSSDKIQYTKKNSHAITATFNDAAALAGFYVGPTIPGTSTVETISLINAFMGFLSLASLIVVFFVIGGCVRLIKQAWRNRP